MLSDVLVAPSMNGLFFTGFLLLLIVIIFAQNYKQFIRLNFYQKITLLSFLTLAIGVHSLIHLGVETVYGFNPYNWI